MKYIIALAIIALASCSPLADTASNPLDLPGGGGEGTVAFDAYSGQGRFAPNFEVRRAVGLYGH